MTSYDATSMCDVIPYATTPGVCDVCGKALRGKQRRWCAKRCANLYRRNHQWSLARTAAKRRDKWTCQRCSAERWQGVKLEVNHVVPRLGQGYGWGCWNHLTNLETLCHDCHCDVTAEQRLARKLAG